MSVGPTQNDPKLTVVVPVYNTGKRLDTCVASILGQTMAAGDYEAVFVDDGSTDGSGERLDELAAEHHHVRVFHLEGTGGPGAPRNVGIDHARGEYVYFLDHDDWLASEALRRMYAMAVRNDSDIVIGKLVGHGRAVALPLFRANRDRADVFEDRLLGVLTPHKLFRTELLRQHGIRFPEGRVWLEDHQFVVPAYFHAKVISVLADYACCHWRKLERGVNLSARKFDAPAYYQAVRQVLALVDTYTEPGATRDRSYATWYIAKLLRKLESGRFVFGWPVRRQDRRTHREVRKLVTERFPDSVDGWLPAPLRVRSKLLRAGGWSGRRDLARLIEADRGCTFQPSLDRIDWESGELVVEISGRFVYADGSSPRIERHGDRLCWRPPVSLRTELGVDAYDLTDELTKSRLDVYVRDRTDQAQYPLPTSWRAAHVDDTIELTAIARMAADTGKLGSPLDPGTWDLLVRADACGWSMTRRLGRREPEQAVPPASSGSRLRPYWTGMGNLSVRVAPADSPGHP